MRVENVDSDRFLLYSNFLVFEFFREGHLGQEWDFDVMMRQKKAERRNKRKSKDGSVNLLSDADDLVKAIVDEMADAANVGVKGNFLLLVLL